MTDSSAATVAGWTAPGWEGVRDVFEANFAKGLEVGAGFSCYHRGAKTVDLWGGVADVETGSPWEEDTLMLVFSTTKGATAICANRLVQQGLLDPDAPVPLDGPATGEAGSEPASAASAGSDAPHGEPLDGGDADGPNQPSLGGGPTLVARPLAPRNFNVVRHAPSQENERQPLPVVLSPDPSTTLARPSQP